MAVTKKVRRKSMRSVNRTKNVSRNGTKRTGKGSRKGIRKGSRKSGKGFRKKVSRKSGKGFRKSGKGSIKKVSRKKGSRKDSIIHYIQKGGEVYKLDRDKVTLTNVELGQGQFGNVMKVIYKDDQSVGIFACKILISENDTNRQEFINEMILMDLIGQHDHIVSMFGVVTSGSPLMLLLQYCQFGSLLDCLKKNTPDEGKQSKNIPVLEITAITVMIQIAKGMDHLSKKRIIHRDLAARNVLVFTKTIVKISDFGLSRVVSSAELEPSEPKKGEKGSPWKFWKRGKKNKNVVAGKHNDDEIYYRAAGNMPVPLRWTAPEGITESKFRLKSDVWSFGVICIEIINKGSIPYGRKTSNETVLDELLNGIPPTIQEDINHVPQEFLLYITKTRDKIENEDIKHVFNMIPEQRTNFNDLIKDLEGFKTNDKDNTKAELKFKSELGSANPEAQEQIISKRFEEIKTRRTSLAQQEIESIYTNLASPGQQETVEYTKRFSSLANPGNPGPPGEFKSIAEYTKLPSANPGNSDQPGEFHSIAEYVNMNPGDPETIKGPGFTVTNV